MRHVMIDIETLGVTPDAAILAIGACAFDPETGDVGDTFYAGIELSYAIKNRRIDADTLAWWLKQSEAARNAAFFQGTYTLREALEALTAWLPSPAVVWGNGSGFDITLLENAYLQVGLLVPWNYRNVRDMRTIVALEAVGKDEIPPVGTAHNALDDAIWQATYVSKALYQVKLALAHKDYCDTSEIR